jgi:hypothetical protein
MAYRGNIDKIIQASQAELNEIAQEKGSIRVGSTKDPIRRAGEYEREGYSGTMYVAKTTNMKYAANKLLKLNPRHNVYSSSNADEDDGYVYVLKGKKF